MVQVAIQGVTVSGDIGATGLSRFHYQRQDAATVLPADCNAAAAAIKTFIAAAAVYYPNDITWAFQPYVTVIEHDSALIQQVISLGTVPANVAGAASGSYAAGNGARVNWKTSSIHGRRFMRGATYLVPFGSTGYTTSGAVSAAAITAITNAGNALLTSLASAALELVVYGRPAKGAETGGHVGLVTAVQVPTQPATLRSRRE